MRSQIAIACALLLACAQGLRADDARTMAVTMDDLPFVSANWLDDHALRAGAGGITWIHRWALTRGVDASMYRGEPETPGYVLELTRLPEHGYSDDG